MPSSVALNHGKVGGMRQSRDRTEANLPESQDPATDSDAPKKYRYRAFISYSHADEAWARWLHKSLETWRVPPRLVGTETATGLIPRRLTPVFRDRDELASAADLGTRVNAALADSANLIVICSPRSAGSRWVNEEVLFYKRLGHAERIFCLIVDGEPNASDIAGRSADECFCPALRFSVDKAGALTGERAEPVAADARAGKDGKSAARLKLIAGMLDVGFDALRQREQQRRMRRMAAITALALVAVLVTSALAITAVLARQQADTARQAAERRQQQSEDLINYMLGDLNDKLGEVGRLDIMQGVADKAMAYFAELPITDVTDTALGQRATALQQIGNIRMNQGKTPDALKAYLAAEKIQAQRLQRAPTDSALEVSYANSLNWVGNAYWFQGELDNAGRKFQRAVETLSSASRSRPQDSEIASKLAEAQNNYGHVLEARGNLGGAKEHYRDVLKIYTTLASQNPDNPQWRESLGYAYNNLGQLALKQGNLEQAIAYYRGDQKIKAALVAGAPNNQQWRSALALSNGILAGALIDAGEIRSATLYARAAVDMGREQVTLNPDSAASQDYLALYRLLLARILRHQQRLDDASALVRKSVDVLSTLASKDPTNSDWPPDLAKAQMESARLAMANGQSDTAEKRAKDALDTIGPLQKKRAGNRTLVLIATQADCLLGDIAAARRQQGTADERWRTGRQRIAPLARASSDPELLAAWSGILLRLGEREAAQPQLARLQKMGYRNPDLLAVLQHQGIAYPPNQARAERIAELMQ